MQATVDAGGLSVDGAYVNLAGDGTFGVAGPLALTNGGWVESDVDTTWSGGAPGSSAAARQPPDSPPTSGFEMVGAQLTITAATSAQAAAGGGEGVIQLDGGATLFKQDATTTTLGVSACCSTPRRCTSSRAG